MCCGKFMALNIENSHTSVMAKHVSLQCLATSLLSQMMHSGIGLRQ